eukprot:414450_1
MTQESPAVKPDVNVDSGPTKESGKHEPSPTSVADVSEPTMNGKPAERGRSRTRSRTGSRTQSRSRSRSPARRSTRRFGPPTDRVLVSGVDMFISEEDIRKVASRWEPACVRVIREIEGQSVGHAILTFRDSELAKGFLEGVGPYPGSVILKDKALFLQYTDGLGDTLAAAGASDWNCAHCSYHNFARRAECLKCSRRRANAPTNGSTPTSNTTNAAAPTAPVPLSAGSKGSGFARGLFAREVVLVERLPSSADEDSVRYSLAPFAAVKAVYLSASTKSPSECEAYVEFHSEDDATEVCRQVRREKLRIDGVAVQARCSMDTPQYREWRRGRVRERERERVRSDFDREISRYDRRRDDLDRDRYDRKRDDFDRGRRDRRDRDWDRPPRERGDERDRYRRRDDWREGGRRDGRDRSRRRSLTPERRRGRSGSSHATMLQNLQEQAVWGWQKKEDGFPKPDYAGPPGIPDHQYPHNMMAGPPHPNTAHMNEAHLNPAYPNTAHLNTDAHPNPGDLPTTLEDALAISQRLVDQGISILNGEIPNSNTAALNTAELSKAAEATTPTASATQSSPQDGFVYDESTGYYYDSTSGYFYDPRTQLYLHGESQVYYRWDEPNQEYIQVDASEAAQCYDTQPTTAQPTPVPVSTDEGPTSTLAFGQKPKKKGFGLKFTVDSAKKKKEQLAPWAKEKRSKININNKPRKLPKSALSSQSESSPVHQNDSKTPKTAKKQRKFSKPTSESTLAAPPGIISPENSGFSGPKSPKRSISESPKAAGSGINIGGGQSKKILDYNLKACLLCRRRFKSVEQLQKHSTDSELHKKNLQIQKYKKTSLEQRAGHEKAAIGLKQEKRQLKEVESDLKRRKLAEARSNDPPPPSQAWQQISNQPSSSHRRGLGINPAKIADPRGFKGSLYPARGAPQSYQMAVNQRMQERFHRPGEANEVGAPNGHAGTDYMSAMKEFQSSDCSSGGEFAR